MTFTLLTLSLITGLPHLSLIAGTLVLAHHINKIISKENEDD
jgi:hypothetical protein